MTETTAILNLVPLKGDLLQRAMVAADGTIERIQDAQELLTRGNAVDALRALGAADESAQSAYLTLQAAGAPAPEGRPKPADIPLHLMDTPATRRLLDALQFAKSCAQEVDRERGWVLADGTGCGLTDEIGDVYERFRQQAEGPGGRE